MKKGSGLIKNLNLEHIEKMAEAGMSRQQIGQWYGVTGQRIGQLVEEHPDLDEAFTRGLAKGIEKASNGLMKLIEEGNLIATIFYLKCQAKWREAQYDKPEPETNVQRVSIYLPHNSRDEIEIDAE